LTSSNAFRPCSHGPAWKGDVSTEINIDMRSVVKSVDQASEAVQREDWQRAEQALVEVQDRVGRLLREIELQRSSPQLERPPSPVKGDLD
jgi:hypothetical protein